MSITVVVPRSKSRNISQIIRNKYTDLWQQWRIMNFPNRSYTRAKLNANIRNALSVNGKTFNEQAFRPATINKWSGRKVLPYAHWYFLVQFQADLFGKVYAIVEDVCYEGDYHNDTMNTKPYGECAFRGLNIITENKNDIMKNKKVIRLTESDLHRVISESVKSVLTELDWKTYANAARKQYGKAYGDDPYNTPMDNEYLRKINRGNRFKRTAEKRFNDEFGYSDPNNEEAYRLDINGERLIGPTSCAWDRTRDAPYPVRKTFGGYRDAFGNSQYRTCELDPSTSSDNLRAAKERGDAELDKYYRDGYRYTKDKGWH